MILAGWGHLVSLSLTQMGALGTRLCPKQCHTSCHRHARMPPIQFCSRKWISALQPYRIRIGIRPVLGTVLLVQEQLHKIVGILTPTLGNIALFYHEETPTVLT